MNKKNNTWFGFSLTQKQSVQIFVLSIIGLLISVFLFTMMLLPIIMNFIYYDPYYYPDDDYFIFTMIFSMFPYLIVFGVLFVLSLYSLIRCKKIAKYYSPLIDPGIEQKPKSSYTEVPPKSIAQFCSNCGEMKKGLEKFCTNCGHQIGYQ